MIVFKLYLKILKRNIITIFVYLGIFIFIMSILINSVQPNELTFKNYETKVAFIDKDQTEFTEALKEYLDEYAKFVDVKEDKLDEAFFHREISFIIEIPEGFTEAFLEGKNETLKYRSSPDSPSAYLLQNQINKYLNLAYIYLHNNIVHTSNLNEAIKETLSQEAIPILPKEKTSDFTYLNLYYNFSAYVIISLMISIIGSIMLAFKPMDIKRRNDIGMISNRKMNLILILANLLLGLIVILAVILVSIILYKDLMFTGNGLFYALNILLFAVSSIALAYLIVTLFNSENVIAAIGQIISLGGAFITGIFIPQFLLDKNVLLFARILPSYWFVKANDGATYNNTHAIIEGVIAQIIFTAIFIIISIIIGKKKQTAEN